MNYNTILFDFGGTLDANGIHSRTLYWRAALSSNLINLSSSSPSEIRTFIYKQFQEAYSVADNKMQQHGLALKLGLKEMNRLQVKLLLENFNYEKIMVSDGEGKNLLTEINSNFINNEKIISCADLITKTQSTQLQNNQSIIKELALNYSLGVVSNFTGNLEVILEEYGLLSYFKVVIDSYHLGASKPDLAPFMAALKALGFNLNSKVRDIRELNQVIMVGDNIDRDLIPASSLGMKTILIQEEGAGDTQRNYGNYIQNYNWKINRLSQLFSLLSDSRPSPLHSK